MSHYASMKSAPNRNGQNEACDLRSDTVTRPDPAMLEAMARAEVGDDVYDDDPTVNRLQAMAAELTGKEAGLYLSSGTQSNLAAMMAHCGRGEEVITGDVYHTVVHEAAGASVLGSLSLWPVATEADGSLDPAKIEAAVKEDDFHHAPSRLLSLENTVSGKVISLEKIAAAAEVARENAMQVHLDGARFFNAVTALGAEPRQLAGLVDTVSLCLSKGLGAPIGSVLVGPEDLIYRAKRIRKMLGGGMRQVGILAAAGIYALENNIAALADDHSRAERLAEHLRSLNGLAPEQVSLATNMVFFTPRPEDHLGFCKCMAEHDIVISGSVPTIRLVLHRDVDEAKFSRLLAALSHFYAR